MTVRDNLLSIRENLYFRAYNFPMRLKILLSTNSKIFPVIYRHRFISFFKQALANVSKLDIYYNSKLPKPFTFSVYMKGTFRNEERIFKLKDMEVSSFYFELESPNITLNFSSLYEDFAIDVFNGLIDITEYEIYEDIKVRPISILPVSEKEIENGSVHFKTLSPIVLESKEDKPITPESENFQKEFNEIHTRIFSSLGIEWKDVNVEVINYNMVKVKHYMHKFFKQTGRKYMILTAFKGVLKVEGDREILKALYRKGIGNRTSQGFGMVEVV